MGPPKTPLRCSWEVDADHNGSGILSRFQHKVWLVRQTPGMADVRIGAPIVGLTLDMSNGTKAIQHRVFLLSQAPQ